MTASSIRSALEEEIGLLERAVVEVRELARTTRVAGNDHYCYGAARQAELTAERLRVILLQLEKAEVRTVSFDGFYPHVSVCGIAGRNESDDFDGTEQFLVVPEPGK